MTGALVNAVADEVWDYEVERSPFLQLRNGIPVTGLPAGTLEESEEDAAFARRQLAVVGAIDSADLATDDSLTASFLRVVLTQISEAPETWWWAFPVTPYGMYPLTVETTQAMASLGSDDPTAATRGRAIAADFARAVRVALDKLQRQTERGWALPREALPGSIATAQGLRATSQRLFAAAAPDVLNGDIAPAVDALQAYLEEYDGIAAAGVGMSQYPGGREAYERRVREHATYDIDVDEVHRIGLAEVERLTEEMAEVRSAVGFRGTEEEFRREAEAAGRMYASGPDDVEARYRAAIARIEPVLGDAFAVLPQAPYDVARLDPSMEAGLTYGFYEPPTTAMPVGRYRYNGSGLETRSQLNAAAIIYHELIPGHHFHLARQKENVALPAVRQNSAAFAAFTEGWAEYAAGVADELGMYEDPWDRYGWLIHQRFVSQRLVVDTGMNALGWSLERAREYMSAMTLESPTQVATETLRYSTDLPGQALGYRLGFLKFRALRESLGRPAPEFHELVLSQGTLPLGVVEEHLAKL